MGREYVGELFIADIGFPKMLMPKVEIAGRETHNLILASHTGGGVGSGTDHEVVAVKGKLRFTPFFGDKFVIGMVWSSPNDAVVSSGAEK